MAKITIAGGSYVIASEISMADLETVKKYRPAALAITDPETKETLFKIGTGANSVNDYGISFGGVSNDEDRLALATLPIPAEVEDARAYVLDTAGLAVVNLNKIEESITSALAGIRAERDAIAENIDVIV